MQPRLDGSDRHAQQDRHLFERQFSKKKERQHFPLKQRELVERMMDLFRVIQVGDRIGLPLVTDALAFVVQLVKLGGARAADRRVAGRAVQERGKRSRIAKAAQRFEHLEPRFLQQLPRILLARHEPAEVIEERPLPQPDDLLKRLPVPPLPLHDQQLGFEKELILGQVVLLWIDCWTGRKKGRRGSFNLTN